MKPVPLHPHLGVRALGIPPAPKVIGCPSCLALERQKEANEEFARRYGYVRDPRRRA